MTADRLMLTARPYYSHDDELCGHPVCVNEPCTFYDHNGEDPSLALPCDVHEECTNFVPTCMPAPLEDQI